MASWTKDELKLLGRFTDEKVATLLNRAVESVRAKRKELGIPRAKKLRKLKDCLALLGTMPDQELAFKLGLSTFSISTRRRELKIPPFDTKKRRWTAEELRLLGKFDDKKVAVILKRHVKKVRGRRLIEQLAPDKRWTKEETLLLFKHSNLEVASITGRPVGSVHSKRQRVRKDPLYKYLFERLKQDGSVGG